MQKIFRPNCNIHAMAEMESVVTYNNIITKEVFPSLVELVLYVEMFI